MTRSQLYDRFHHLGEILNYSRNKGYFTDGQRTCIHQERASILRTLERMRQNATPYGRIEYQLPEEMIPATRLVSEMIEKETGWTYEYDTFKRNRITKTAA